MAITQENITIAEPSKDGSDSLGRTYDIRRMDEEGNIARTTKDRWSVYIPKENFEDFSTPQDILWALNQEFRAVFPYPEMGEYKGAQLSWSLWAMDPENPEEGQEIGVITKYPTNLARGNSPEELVSAREKMLENWKELYISQIALRLTPSEKRSFFKAAKAAAPLKPEKTTEEKIKKGLLTSENNNPTRIG